jgi:hypothetical protein
MTRRNLILIYRGLAYDRDFNEIAERVHSHDPRITIFSLPANLETTIPDAEWRYPTLTVALTAKYKLPIKRGPILQNHQIGKLAQQDISPPTRNIDTPGTSLHIRHGAGPDRFRSSPRVEAPGFGAYVAEAGFPVHHRAAAWLHFRRRHFSLAASRLSATVSTLTMSSNVVVGELLNSMRGWNLRELLKGMTSKTANRTSWIATRRF